MADRNENVGKEDYKIRFYELCKKNTDYFWLTEKESVTLIGFYKPYKCNEIEKEG